MHPDRRTYFDYHLEAVLQELPEEVHRLLDEVPLIVDDYPSPRVCQRLGVRHPDDLCGLYTGVPRTDRSIQDTGIPSDVIQIFRAGILRLAEEAAGPRRSGEFRESAHHDGEDREGDRDRERRDGELRRQIRTTILHEVGHHFGLSEDDLEELGYG